MRLKPDLKDEIRALLAAEGPGLSTRYVARKLGRNWGRVVQVMRELREEQELWGSSPNRIDLFDKEIAHLRGEGPDPFIPIYEDDGDRDTPIEPMPACRIHVERPVANYTYPAGRKLLLIPDTHAPFHDRLAWDCMMRFAREYRPDTVIHLGDLADFYSVSDHDKDNRRANNLIEECKVTNTLLDELDNLGATQKIFCTGNHCYRLERYLMRQAPALLGAVSLDGLLNLQTRGWHVVPYMQHARVGNLHVTHDVGKSGVNAVQQTAQAVGHNIVFGHTHRLALTYFGTVIGERYVSATCGWLGDMQAASYVSNVTKAQWQHGFGIATMESSGDFQLQLIPIVDYRIVQ